MLCFGDSGATLYEASYDLLKRVSLQTGPQHLVKSEPRKPSHGNGAMEGLRTSTRDVISPGQPNITLTRFVHSMLSVYGPPPWVF